MSRSTFVIAVLVLSAVTAPCPTTLSAADARAKHITRLVKALEKDGMKPVDIKVTMPVGEAGRTQFGFVTSKTTDVAGIEYFTIWSIAARSDTGMDAETMRFAMQDSSGRALPAWQLMAVGGQEALVAAVSLPVDVPDRQFLISLGTTWAVADSMEEQLTKADRY